MRQILDRLHKLERWMDATADSYNANIGINENNLLKLEEKVLGLEKELKELKDKQIQTSYITDVETEDIRSTGRAAVLKFLRNHAGLKFSISSIAANLNTVPHLISHAIGVLYRDGEVLRDSATDMVSNTTRKRVGAYLYFVDSENLEEVLD